MPSQQTHQTRNQLPAIISRLFIIGLFLLPISLSSCRSRMSAPDLPGSTALVPPSMPRPSTARPVTSTPATSSTLLPSPSSSPSPSPVQTGKPRWQTYQQALASALLTGSQGRIEGRCEWEILGKRKDQVYVWAMCQAANRPLGQAVSAPAVVNLDEQGTISSIKLPRDGEYYAPDVRDMFPEDIQETIFAHDVPTGVMWEHIQERQKQPEPPLIANSKTPLP